jgi:hypothetical protein
MTKRMLAGAAVVAAVLVVAGAPASAQTYPPPVRSITVDDTTPAPGQSIVVTLQTCRAGSTALVGIDLTLVASPRVGADGVARATVTVPSRLRPGRHTVSGACLAPDLSPLFLTTTITVTAPGGGGGGGTGTGTATPGAVAPPSGDADGSQDAGNTGGAGAASVTPRGGAASSTGPRIPSSSLANLAAPDAPPDAPAVFGDIATANGVTEGGSAPPEATASRTPGGAGSSGSGPGTLSTLARVALGVAALGGVPVALAVSRRPQRVARRGFA